MKITAALLKEKGACKDDIRAFEKQWPNGCKVTRKNCRIAFNVMGLDVTWAAAELLSIKEFAKYQEVCYSAQAKYARRYGCWVTEERVWAKYRKARIEAFYQAARG